MPWGGTAPSHGREGGARVCTLYYDSVSDFTIATGGSATNPSLPSHLSAKRGQSCSFEECPFLVSVVSADVGLPARPCQVQMLGRTAFIPQLFRYGDNVLASFVSDQCEMMLPTPLQ